MFRVFKPDGPGGAYARCFPIRLANRYRYADDVRRGAAIFALGRPPALPPTGCENWLRPVRCRGWAGRRLTTPLGFLVDPEGVPAVLKPMRA